MKLKTLSITKFRSIKNSELYFNDINAIVGQNNSGKSSLLRALNAFFNPELELNSFIDKSHQYTAKTKPIIELTFSEVPDKNPFKSFTISGELTIKLIFDNRTNRLIHHIKNKRKYKEASKSFMGSLFGEIGFVLIPAIRNYEQTVANEKTILKNLLDKYLSIYTAKRDTFSRPVMDAVKNLHNNALKKVSTELNKNYNSKHNFKFSIQHYSELNYAILLNDLSLNIEESDKLFKLIDCGSGIQSLANIAIYRLFAKLDKRKIILGIEEPEINLHPQAQKEFINNINNGVGTNEIQVIMSTHSSVIVDKLEHTNIILCKKEPATERGFITNVYQLPSDYWTKYNLTEIKYNKFFQYHNSEFFFSNYVIIVESDIDAEVVKYLAKEAKVDIDALGISILNLDGIRNMKYPYFLTKELNIPKLIIVDKDFFLKYSTDIKEQSRYTDGFFNYRKEYHSSSIIDEVIHSPTDKSAILDLFISNHSKALDKLERYNTICFKYNLEMDLINSKTARQVYYQLLNIPSTNQNSNFLLVNCKDSIKNIKNIHHVLQNISHANLPNSYKRIKKYLQKLEKNIK